MGVYGGDGVEQIKALFCWHMDLELRWDDYGESQLSLPSVTVAQFLRGSRYVMLDRIRPLLTNSIDDYSEKYGMMGGLVKKASYSHSGTSR